MRAVLLVWLLCQPLPALSQQPPTRPKPPVSQSDSNEKPPQQDQRGTQASPLVVELESIQANTQAAQADSQRREETAINRSIARYTGSLVIVAILQLVMFGWQLLKIRAGLADTKKAADAAEKSANAADLSARAAVHVERPHITCSNVILKGMPHGGTQDPETGEFTPDPEQVRRGEFYRVQFAFTNYGKTPGFVTSIGYWRTVAATPPASPVYEVIENLADVIRPGESLLFTLPEPLNISVGQQRLVDELRLFPWFWGKISYRDFLDGEGESGFIAYRHHPNHLPTNIPVPPSGVSFGSSPGYTFRRYRPARGHSSEHD